ncbi:MAG: hypothetical protein ACI88H_000472 [Cocleimonas sp.]|jgi:hypothetical protein
MFKIRDSDFCDHEYWAVSVLQEVERSAMVAREFFKGPLEKYREIAAKERLGFQELSNYLSWKAKIQNKNWTIDNCNFRISSLLPEAFFLPNEIYANDLKYFHLVIDKSVSKKELTIHDLDNLRSGGTERDPRPFFTDYISKLKNKNKIIYHIQSEQQFKAFYYLWSGDAFISKPLFYKILYKSTILSS